MTSVLVGQEESWGRRQAPGGRGRSGQSMLVMQEVVDPAGPRSRPRSTGSRQLAEFLTFCSTDTMLLLLLLTTTSILSGFQVVSGTLRPYCIIEPLIPNHLIITSDAAVVSESKEDWKIFW